MSADPIADLHEAIDALASTPPADGDPVGHRVDMWHALQDAARTLGVVVREWSTAAGDSLADIEYDRKQGWKSPGGVVVHHAQSATDEYDGRAVLSALGDMLVDTDTGERVEAVPVSVLADVLPAINAKSSKWRARGLNAHGVDPDRYRKRQWGAPQVKIGPMK